MNDAVALRRARAASQLLVEDATRAPQEVVHRLLAVQAQDGAAAARALAVRGAGPAAGKDGEGAGPGVVLTWLVRGTLHLACVEDWRWLHGLTAPTRRATNARRLDQEGVSPAEAERGADVLVRALADTGPLSRAGARAVLDRADVRSAGQATPHLLLKAALDGRLVFDPVTRDAVHVPDPPAPLEGEARDRALAELGRRYLAGHAPADEHDLAHWSGLPLRDARAALAAAGWRTFDVADTHDVPHPVPPRLLGAFDPFLLGWRTREHAVEDRHARLVFPGGGIIRAVATVDALVVGTWTKAGGIDWLADVGAQDRAALEAQLP